MINALITGFTMKHLDTLIEQGQVTDPESAKGRLLRGAAHLFREKGYERTTVRDIANEIGIQSGSLFHHFKTKEDILKAVMTETVLYNTAKMRGAVEAANGPKEQLFACILCELASIHSSDTVEAMSVLVSEWRSLSKANQQDVLKLRDIYEQSWISALTAAKEQGLVVGDVFILRRFLTGAMNWTTNWYKLDGDLSLEDLAAEALKLALGTSE